MPERASAKPFILKCSGRINLTLARTAFWSFSSRRRAFSLAIGFAATKERCAQSWHRSSPRSLRGATPKSEKPWRLKGWRARPPTFKGVIKVDRAEIMFAKILLPPLA